MKAMDLSQFAVGETEKYELIVQVEVFGQLINKRISYMKCDDNMKRITLHLEKIELK